MQCTTINYSCLIPFNTALSKASFNTYNCSSAKRNYFGTDFFKFCTEFIIEKTIEIYLMSLWRHFHATNGQILMFFHGLERQRAILLSHHIW